MEPNVEFEPPMNGGANMKHHMDGEVRWVWILTSLAILYIVGLYVIP